MVRHCISPGEDRPHSIYRYTDQIYKVIQWYRVMYHSGPGPAAEHEHYDKKLDASVSRSRRLILEKALCNHWDWFCTFTISDDNYSRQDLGAWHKDFSQWLRDQRKKGIDVKYLLVPEMHADGLSWHAHGLLSGLDASQLVSFRQLDKDGYRTAQGRRLPVKLRNSQYMNWPAYQQKFGFCSLGAVQNPVATAFYVTKYITKEKSRMVQDVGLRSFYTSVGLQGAAKHLDFFGRDPEIDRLLVNKYDFCSTGMTHLKDNCDWSFGGEFINFDDLEPLVLSAECNEISAPEIEADNYANFEQLMLSTFGG